MIFEVGDAVHHKEHGFGNVTCVYADGKVRVFWVIGGSSKVPTAELTKV